MDGPVLRLIEFEESKRHAIFEALSSRMASIRYIKPTQFIITGEGCDHLKSLDIKYNTLADLDPKTLEVLKWHVSN